jgi:hypothetical protein
MDVENSQPFDLLSQLLPELRTYILLTFLREESLRPEFPKLFCVCKWWVTEHLDSPTAHQLIGMSLRLLFLLVFIFRGDEGTLVPQHCGQQPPHVRSLCFSDDPIREPPRQQCSTYRSLALRRDCEGDWPIRDEQRRLLSDYQWLRALSE